jgi:heat shock protein HslJ
LAIAIALIPQPAVSKPGAYTARGQEPGWMLTIGGQSIALTTQAGEHFKVAHPRPGQPPQGRYDVVFKGKPVTISIASGICRDTMSGMPHPDSVTISGIDGELKGCGGAPRALLGTDEWSITEIGSAPILAGTAPAIAFFDDSKVAGNASCNWFRGNFKLTGEGLRLEKFSRTLMGCATDVLRQEDAVIEHLKALHSFDIRVDGALILKDAKGGTLVAVRKAK